MRDEEIWLGGLFLEMEWVGRWMEVVAREVLWG